MATNKQTYNSEIYKKRLKEAKEEYNKRKEYVAKFNLPLTGEEEQEVSTDSEESSGSSVPDEGISTGGGGSDAKGLIDLAKTKMKAPYVFGAAGPTTFDCSGFICWVYNKRGYKFGRTTAAGYHSMFEKTTNPVPGDIIFFSNTYKPGVSHIGIWMGNNEFIHTANKRNGVQISTLTGYWKGKFTSFGKADKYYKGSVNDELKAEANMLVTTSTKEEVIGDEAVYPPLEDEGYFESKFIPTYYFNPVRFRGGSIFHSNDSREVFLHNRIGWARNTKYKDLQHLNKNLFIHQDHYDGIEGNLYSYDAKRLFESLLLKTKKPYFEVISGFRFSNPGQLSPHEAGCAMDIRVESIDEVREIADCAWQLGVRSIAIGGEFDNKKGFIHIDIAPKGKDFMYDGVPIYGGPGKWVTQ